MKKNKLSAVGRNKKDRSLVKVSDWEITRRVGISFVVLEQSVRKVKAGNSSEELTRTKTDKRVN